MLLYIMGSFVITWNNVWSFSAVRKSLIFDGSIAMPVHVEYTVNFFPF